MSKERAAQLIDAGLWLKLSGDLDGAQKLFERALKLDPENEKARTLLDGSADSQPVVPSVLASQPSGITNPFSRNESITVPGTVPVDAADWGMATGFESPAPFQPPAIAPTVSPVPSMVVSSDSQAPTAEEVWSDTDSFGTAPQGQSSPAPAIAPVVMTRPPGGVTVVLGETPPEPPTPIQPTPPVFMSSSHSPVPRATPPQFEQTPRSVVLSGTPPPLVPAFTPPLYAGAPIVEPPNTIRLSGDPAPASPPRSSPPVSAGQMPPPASSPPLPPGASPPRSSDSAWNWAGPHASSAHSASSASSIQGTAAPWPANAPLASPPSPGFEQKTAWDAKSNPGISLGNVVGEGKALELVGTDVPVVSSPSNTGTRLAAEVRALLRGARDLLDLDDHTGAVELILKAQTIAPDDAEVQALRDRSERTLLAMFESKLGNMNAVPRVLLKDDEIIWLNLDHRAGFVLAQIDGSVSFDDVFAVSGMSRLDTARIIAQLIDEGVISRG